MLITTVLYCLIVGGSIYSAPAVTSLMGGAQPTLASNLTQAGSTKPFQLQKPPLGKKKQFLS